MKKFEMSEEQKKLFDALAPLAQRVALNSLSGMSNIDSYIKGGGTAKKKETQESGASEILSNPKVKAFLDSMKVEIVSDKIMSRERMMEIQTAIANMTDKDLELIALGSLTELKDGFNVKLKAMKQLADLGGYEAPKEIKIDAAEELTPWGNIAVSVDK